MKGTKILKILIPVLVILISSCRTIPEGPYPDIVDWLPLESDIILRMEIPGNEDLADFLISYMGLNPEDFSDMKDRTALLAVGIELGDSLPGDTEDEGSLNSFQMKNLPVHMASIGIWPKNLLGAGLGKDWKRSGLSRYSWSGPDNLEITALSNNEIILSRGKTDVMLERLETKASNPILQRALDLRNGAALAIWITNPDIVLEAMPMMPAKKSDGSPLIDIIGLALRRRDDGNFALLFNIYPSDSRLSGALALALRLGFSSRFGMSPNPEERALLSELSVEISTGEVSVLLPSVSMDILGGFLSGFHLIPELGDGT